MSRVCSFCGSTNFIKIKKITENADFYLKLCKRCDENYTHILYKVMKDNERVIIYYEGKKGYVQLKEIF